MKNDDTERILEAVVDWLRRYWNAARRKAKWTESATVVLTLGTAVAAFWSAYIFNRQLHEAHQQTCLQQQAAMNAERAWVGLSSTPQVSISSLKQKQFNAEIALELKNFGKGPALNVYSLSLFATHGHVQEQITTACNLIFPFVGLKPTSPVQPSSDLSKAQWGALVFPGQPPFIQGHSTIGNSADILGQEVFIVGCIVYKDQFETPHWTKFSYSTGAFATHVVRDASSFRHLYTSTANNYTDDAEKEASCTN